MGGLGVLYQKLHFALEASVSSFARGGRLGWGRISPAPNSTRQQKEPPATAGGSFLVDIRAGIYRSMTFMVPSSGLYWKRVTRSSFCDSKRTTSVRPSSLVFKVS